MPRQYKSLSEETRQKISIARKEYYKTHIPWNSGKHLSLDTKIKIGLAHKGKNISYEQRLKLSKALKGTSPWIKGRNHTELSKRKISEAAKKMWQEKREKLIESHSGKHNSRWKGGKRKTGNGYIEILNHAHPYANEEGYIAEHRIVIEKIIGRYLLTTEVVHHLGEKDDNRPQMLMAFINHSAHKRFENNPKNIKAEEIIFDGRLFISS
jgi:uncharacterized protein (DUF1330 family)